MHEVMEEGKEHAEEPGILPVAVTLAILAVLVAMATLMGHRAATEELLLQTQASDQWAYFQAKNIRLHEMQGVADMLGTVVSVEKEKAEALREQYLQEVERYDKEKDQISDQAKELENERAKVARREDRYDAAEVILEIALIVCSLTLLTKKRFFWMVGILLGIAGVAVGMSGFLLHRVAGLQRINFCRTHGALVFVR